MEIIITFNCVLLNRYNGKLSCWWLIQTDVVARPESSPDCHS